MASNTETGRAGEFYAAYKLQCAGANVAHISQSFDLLYTSGSGAMTSIEVKCARRAQTDGSAHFNIKNFSADWLALVWLPGPAVLMCSPRDLSVKSCIAIPPDRFTEESEQTSINQFLEAVS